MKKYLFFTKYTLFVEKNVFIWKKKFIKKNINEKVKKKSNFRNIFLHRKYLCHKQNMNLS